MQQNSGGFGQAFQGLFGQQMMPFWAGLAFGGTRQDQGRLASQALMQGNQLQQQQGQFEKEQQFAREQLAALNDYRNSQIGLQRDQFNAQQAMQRQRLQMAQEERNRNPFVEKLQQIEAIPDQYLGEDPTGTRQALMQSALSAGQEARSFADMVKGESDLRKEVNALPEVKNSLSALTSFERISSAAAGESGPDDIAIIFNYMKMLDPESVVRESEYATAANAAGVPERVRAMFNRIKNGERLAPDTRKSFLSAAARQANVYTENLRSVRERYGPVVDSYGYDRSRVLPRGGDPTAYTQVYDYNPETRSFTGLEK